MSASSFPLSTRPETLLSRRRTLLLLVVLVSAAAVVAAASPASSPEAEAEAEGGATPRRRVFFLDDEEEEEEEDTLRATQTCVNVQSRPAPPSPPPPATAAPPADSPFWADEADMEIVKCEVRSENEMQSMKKNVVKSGMSGAGAQQVRGGMYGGWRQMQRIQAPQTRRDLKFSRRGYFVVRPPWSEISRR